MSLAIVLPAATVRASTGLALRDRDIALFIAVDHTIATAPDGPQSWRFLRRSVLVGARCARILPAQARSLRMAGGNALVREIWVIDLAGDAQCRRQ
jgi:hypothetical protein